MIDVVVSGAAGRMGREVVQAVTAADGMRVVAAVDPASEGAALDDGAGSNLTCESDLAAALDRTAAHVMVDFTHPSAVERNLRTALERGVDCVLGTTGITTDTLKDLAESAQDDACLFVAPNFAIGAVLMMRFAAEAARFLPHVEIVELHHDRKADAPSGTALRTASLIAAARSEIPDTPGRETEIAEGARGAIVDHIAVHSIRLPGLVAHQEVIFGGKGQTLSIRHDSIDRTSFMPGVVLAVREVGSRAGLIVGLEHLMSE